jgi:dihydrofolate reductase
MATVVYGMRVSVDGFVADRDGDLSPLYSDLGVVREHELVAEEIEEAGAVVMGRESYDLFDGDVTDYEFQVPIFVVTHDPPAEGPKGQNDRLTVAFVPGGVTDAVERAREAAGDRTVQVIGASVGQQALVAGVVDEVSVWVAPILLGGGKTMFGELDEVPRLEQARVRETGADAELRYRVLR